MGQQLSLALSPAASHPIVKQAWEVLSKQHPFQQQQQKKSKVRIPFSFSLERTLSHKLQQEDKWER